MKVVRPEPIRVIKNKELTMALRNIRLGDYIKRSTINNRDEMYGIDLIVGVTNDGIFSTSKGLR